MYKYRLIIADDEPFIRKNLYNLITKRMENIQCVALCENGEQVLNILNTTNVDILICDIKMPVKTGIDIAKYIHEKKIRTQVIFISGFTEFEYAYKAVEYNVASYILKPIDFEEIILAVQKVIDEMEKQKEQTLNNTTLELNKQEIARLYLSLYFNGIIPYERLLETSAIKKNFNEHKACFAVDLSVNTIKQSISEEVDFTNVWIDIFEISNENLTCYCVNQNQNSAQMLCYVYDENGEFIVKSHFEECKKIMLGAYKVDFDYNISTMEKREENSRVNIRQLSQAFVNNMANFKQSINYELIKILFLMTNIYSTKKFLNYAVDIIKEEYNFFDKEISKSIEKIETLDDAIRLSDRLNEQFYLGGMGENVVKNVVAYVESHFGEHNLDINYIASEFNFNRSYLSRIFKQYIGKNLSNYIYDFRIEKAKELLSTKKYTVKHIAHMVGYNSERYFGQVFKKATGFTPLEFVQREE